ncbi:hypothetical protein BB561_004862 [Smittium simulii]|uniref:GH18 domain-containing protein n=1 Tax=Smittium simulii TaxID=133385 RepID=A0A2T9YDS6_9FUNG|nr:hypothetical protein BB561_004862 [Smittium simulii]
MDVGFKTVGYFGSWNYYNKFKLDEIPIEKLSHLVYGFAKINDGRVGVYDPWLDLDIRIDNKHNGLFSAINDPNGSLKSRNPKFKSIISVGGWTLSKEFSPIAMTSKSRKVFADSVVDFVEKYGFDGVDIDWEYPVKGGDISNKYDPKDGENFVHLISEVRSSLNKHGKKKTPNRHYDLGIAISPNPQVAMHVNFTRVSEIVDFMSIMAYDFSGSWSGKVEHNSNTLSFDTNTEYSAKNTVKFYLDQKVDRKKLLLGSAFYGKIFRDVENEKFGNVIGLNQPKKSVAYYGEVDGISEHGVMFYKNIKQYTRPDNSAGFVQYFDRDRATPYLYSKTKKLWITYENKKSIMYKCALINKLGLGGFMFWEVSQDYNNELANAISLCKKFRK